MTHCALKESEGSGECYLLLYLYYIIRAQVCELETFTSIHVQERIGSVVHIAYLCMDGPVCYTDFIPFYNEKGGFPMGKTSAAVKNRYAAKVYDRINLIVKKGQKEVIQAHAQKRNESLNGFINRAIEEAMQRDDKKES